MRWPWRRKPRPEQIAVQIQVSSDAAAIARATAEEYPTGVFVHDGVEVTNRFMVRADGPWLTNSSDIALLDPSASLRVVKLFSRDGQATKLVNLL